MFSQTFGFISELSENKALGVRRHTQNHLSVRELLETLNSWTSGSHHQQCEQFCLGKLDISHQTTLVQTAVV